MAREFLTDLVAENRIDKIRIIHPNDPVIGGQPNDNEDEFSSNISARDLACTILYTINEIEEINKIKVKDERGESITDPASQRLVNEAFGLIEALPISAGYSATRKYQSGDLVKIDGIWYEAYHPDGVKGKDPRDKTNRPSGWTDSDVHAPYHWVEIGKSLMAQEIGTPIFLMNMQPREGLVKLRNDGQLSATKFHRVAELNPNLVQSGFLSIADFRANAIRALDDGKGVDAGRVINSYQADAMQQIEFDLFLSSRGVINNGTNFEAIRKNVITNAYRFNALKDFMETTNENWNNIVSIDFSKISRMSHETRMMNLAMLAVMRI